jgi:hypothetical protein
LAQHFFGKWQEPENGLLSLRTLNAEIFAYVGGFTIGMNEL